MYLAKVKRKEFLTEKIVLLHMEPLGNKVEAFKPGQFLKIKVYKEGFDPLFPRPFTVHYIEGTTLQILFQIIGKGTKLLSEVREGEILEFLGPLGKPFPKEIEYPLALCAGGIGVAGFPFFLKCLSMEEREKTFLFYGAKSKKELVRLDLLKELCPKVCLATEDGSLGYKGYVTELLEEELKKGTIKTLLACGPFPMLKKIKKLGELYNVKIYLVLETFMACGTGFCLGCVIPKKEGGYFHLCKDGPTLLANLVEL
ncbi:MAG: dihydroorotate dehydrogenase electron transfer subunit [Caldimicrobium sp.]